MNEYNKITIHYSIDPVIQYRDIFEDVVKPEFFLDKVPFSTIIDFTSTILAQDFQVLNHQNLLQEIMLNCNSYKSIIQKLDNNEEVQRYSTYDFFSQIGCLRLLEFALIERENFKDFEKTENEEIIFNLIKLNLLFNQIEVDVQNIGSTKINEDDESYDLKMLLIYSLPQIEFSMYNSVNYSSIINQKTRLLTEFLYQNNAWSKVTKHLLDSMGVIDLAHFQRSCIELVKLTLVKEDEIGKKIILTLDKQDPNYENSKLILDFLSKYQIETDQDFRLTRQNPLIRISEDAYIILFPYLLLRKLDTGIFFELKQGFNSLSKEEKQIISNSKKDGKKFEFKPLYGKQFIEEFLIPKSFTPLFDNPNAIIIGDDEIEKKYDLKGRSDLYIRDKNNIFVIESKDILMATATKTSYDYFKIEDFLRDRLNNELDNKGIPQIINNIKKILYEPIPFDPDCILDDSSKIYPIIIVNDEAFNALGISALLNDWFENKLLKDGLSDPRIQPLTLITIDSVLHIDVYNKAQFTTEKKLNELIDDYHKALRLPGNSPYLSFAHFFQFLIKPEALKYEQHIPVPEESQIGYNNTVLVKKRKKKSKGEKKTSSRNKYSPRMNRKLSKKKNK